MRLTLALLAALTLAACIQPDAADAPAPPPDVIDGPDGLALTPR
jgi:hypothetical protein